MTTPDAQQTPAAGTMMLTHKYRLNLTRPQHRALEGVLEQQRQLYNAALEERIDAYAKRNLTLVDHIQRQRAAGIVEMHDAEKGSVAVRRRADINKALLKTITIAENRVLHGVSEMDQSRSLTIIRADDPDFAAVQRRIQRQTLKRLDRAYKAFFQRAKAGAGAASGFPRFKGYHYFDGFGFDAFQQIKWDGKRLRFDGVPGGLRVHLDRPLPLVADTETGALRTSIKNIWFKGDGRSDRGGFRRWTCGFQVESPRVEDRRGCGSSAVGVDWGTSVLAALSTGETISNPRPGEALADDMARAQRAVARTSKRGRGRMKARRRLQAIQRRIANRRRDTLDKVSKRLVTHFGTVAIEKIDARDLMNAERPGETLPTFVKQRRNREALDAAPFLLRQMLTYKAERHRATLLVTDAANTTQECWWCGRPHFKELSDAEHVCTTPGVFFGRRAPRKVNAARVILKRAFAALATETKDSAVAVDSGGGLVPGGLDGRKPAARNDGTGLRRLGNTEAAQAASGRRPDRGSNLMHVDEPAVQPKPTRRR